MSLTTNTPVDGMIGFNDELYITRKIDSNRNDLVSRIGDGVPFFMKNLSTSNDILLKNIRSSIEGLLIRDGYKGHAFVNNYLKILAINSTGVVTFDTSTSEDGVFIGGLNFALESDEKAIISNFTNQNSFYVGLRYSSEWYLHDGDKITLGTENITTMVRLKVKFELIQSTNPITEYTTFGQGADNNFSGAIAIAQVSNFGTGDVNIADIRFMINNVLLLPEYKRKMDLLVTEAKWESPDGEVFELRKKVIPQYPNQVTSVSVNANRLLESTSPGDVSIFAKTINSVNSDTRFVVDVSWAAPTTTIDGGVLHHSIKHYMVKKYKLTQALSPAQITSLETEELSSVISGGLQSMYTEIVVTQDNSPVIGVNGISQSVVGVRELRAITFQANWNDYYVLAIYPKTEHEVYGKVRYVYIDVGNLEINGVKIRNIYKLSLDELDDSLDSSVISGGLDILRTVLTPLRGAILNPVSGLGRFDRFVHFRVGIDGIPNNSIFTWRVAYHWSMVAHPDVPVMEGELNQGATLFSVEKPNSSSSVWDDDGKAVLRLTTIATNPFNNTHSIESIPVSYEVSVQQIISASDMVEALVTDEDAMSLFTAHLVTNKAWMGVLADALANQQEAAQ